MELCPQIQSHALEAVQLPYGIREPFCLGPTIKENLFRLIVLFCFFLIGLYWLIQVSLEAFIDHLDYWLRIYVVGPSWETRRYILLKKGHSFVYFSMFYSWLINYSVLPDLGESAKGRNHLECLHLVRLQLGNITVLGLGLGLEIEWKSTSCPIFIE